MGFVRCRVESHTEVLPALLSLVTRLDHSALRSEIERGVQAFVPKRVKWPSLNLKKPRKKKVP
jgi:hypothetical protein